MLTSSPAALSSVSTSVVQSVSVAEYLLLRVPSCDDIEILEQPIKFDWPNIEKRIEELGDALWGYYHCNQPQKDLVAFYQAHMPEAPYNNQETNWIERAEGDVGIYYNPANAWVYIWIVPRPGVPEQSLVIVAQSYVLIHC